MDNGKHTWSLARKLYNCISILCNCFKYMLKHILNAQESSFSAFIVVVFCIIFHVNVEAKEFSFNSFQCSRPTMIMKLITSGIHLICGKIPKNKQLFLELILFPLHGTNDCVC